YKEAAPRTRGRLDSPRERRMNLSVMRRPWLVAGLGVVGVLCAALWLTSPNLFGKPQQKAEAPKQAQTDPKPADPPARPQPAEPREKLPIGQVILYSSGVGYFQREGTVEGDARIDLSFDVRDINDLI